MPKLKYRTRMPRPDDPSVLRRIYQATRKGHPITTAGTLAGLGESTAYEWYKLGQAQLQDGEEHGSHVRFAKVVNLAEAQRVDALLDLITEHGRKGNWVALMTREERRRPQDFARRFEAKVETTIDQHVTFSVEALSPARQRALAELALKSLPAPEQDQDTVEGEVAELPGWTVEHDASIPIPRDPGDVVEGEVVE
ncbi:hypothetical protein LCGC14_0745220 [marine sediment metagenome]|uniref:Uncharacterized protein n=1 Tax=marine sediment metagenome TaxID=412755 RepID=A0A0F9Q9Q7_9ZZZZ